MLGDTGALILLLSLYALFRLFDALAWYVGCEIIVAFLFGWVFVLRFMK